MQFKKIFKDEYDTGKNRKLSYHNGAIYKKVKIGNRTPIRGKKRNFLNIRYPESIRTLYDMCRLQIFNIVLRVMSLGRGELYNTLKR